MSAKQTVANTIPEFDLSFEPVDWPQLYTLAKLTPGQRMLAMAQSSAFMKSVLRGSFRRRFPDRSISEINMMMLAYLSNQSEYSG
jgi:hypothetical protein